MTQAAPGGSDDSPSAPGGSDDPPFPDDAVEVGRVMGAWGIKGGIRVVPFSKDPQALFSSRRWFVRPPESPTAPGPRPPATLPPAAAHHAQQGTG